MEKAAKLRSAYVPTFLNPGTGLLAGWKSADGALHDYGFTFVQGLAITCGLVDDSTAHVILDRMLAKIREVGFERFKALYQLGRAEDARRILHPMLETYANGGFQGFGENGMSRDWRDWSGGCHGYEGLLVDNFLPLLAVLDDVRAS